MPNLLVINYQGGEHLNYCQASA